MTVLAQQMGFLSLDPHAQQGSRLGRKALPGTPRRDPAFPAHKSRQVRPGLERELRTVGVFASCRTASSPERVAISVSDPYPRGP